MNGASVVASLPLTSPLITPSTGEAEPRGSSCVLYDAYNTFRTIPIRNVLNVTNEGASGVCSRTVQVVQSIFLPFLHLSTLPEDPTMTLPKVHPTMTLCPYIHGEKTPPALLACLSRHPSSCRVRAKRSREGAPAFCMIPIMHSAQYIFVIF